MATASVEAAAAVRGSMTPLPYRVLGKRRENHDNWTLQLEPVDDAIDPIGPGQFNMLYAFGVGEVPISTSGDIEKTGTTLVHTIRAVGAATNALCAARPGDVLGVRGPFGNQWPIEAARGKDLLIVAGGVGLAQSQSMTAVLGPLQSFAFAPKALVTIASEKATLRVELTGAPAGAAMTRVRIYHVKMSPSGNA